MQKEIYKQFKWKSALKHAITDYFIITTAVSNALVRWQSPHNMKYQKINLCFKIRMFSCNVWVRWKTIRICFKVDFSSFLSAQKRAWSLSFSFISLVSGLETEAGLWQPPRPNEWKGDVTMKPRFHSAKARNFNYKNNLGPCLLQIVCL